jgi:hypothetical protein
VLEILIVYVLGGSLLGVLVGEDNQFWVFICFIDLGISSCIIVRLDI